ncbi:MAG: hypothetical protein OJF49_004166 [Ktedonobacterales bacterium]|nr:MAG: hypothetical protein OJF49_004166 [Ktedonobacterales bacterium]
MQGLCRHDSWGFTLTGPIRAISWDSNGSDVTWIVPSHARTTVLSW